MVGYKVCTRAHTHTISEYQTKPQKSNKSIIGKYKTDFVPAGCFFVPTYLAIRPEIGCSRPQHTNIRYICIHIQAYMQTHAQHIHTQPQTSQRRESAQNQVQNWCIDNKICYSRLVLLVSFFTIRGNKGCTRSQPIPVHISRALY